MKKSVVLLILVFVIIVIGIIAINAQSPTPSPTNSPTPSQTPICSGEVEEIFQTERQIGPDTPMTFIEKILKDMIKELYNNQDLKDFIDCKRPASFCTSSDCKKVLKSVLIAFYIFTPSSASIDPEASVCQKTGIIEKFIPLTKAATIDAILNNYMPEVMGKLQEITDYIMSNCPCPEGSSRTAIITITNI